MLIAYRNLLDREDVVYGILLGGFLANAPFENVLDRRLAVVAISDGLDSIGGTHTIRVDFEWDTDVEIGIGAYLGHSINAGEEVKFTGFSAGGATIFNTTLSSVYLPPALSQFPRHTYIVLDQTYTVRRVRFNITGVVGHQIELGRLWAGPVWEPEGKTAQRDFHMHTRDDSVVTRSIGQQVYVDYKPRYRQLACAIPYLTEAEAIGTADGETQNLQDIAFEVGRGGEVIVIPSTHSDTVVHRFGVYGHFLEPPTVHLLDANRQKGRLYSTEFDVLETL